MAKKKLVITHELGQPLIEAIKSTVPSWEVIVSKDPTIWKKHLSDAEVIAGWKKEMLTYCFTENSKLKWLQTWSAGVNKIPLEEMKNRNMLVTSANGVHAYPISETIFALMLGLTRQIHHYVRNQQEKKWHHANLKLEIHEKTIGIIGVGAIGKETAKIAKAFGMKVLGVRNSGQKTEYVDHMYTPNELNNMLPQCDYVVVTLPLTKETEGMFGKEQFSHMKNSAFFINIGRGDIVVENELIAALRNDEIAGAGLDVFQKEPLESTSPLWAMENVIVTPHTSGSTEHYDERVIHDIFIPNLLNYMNDEELTINVVDYDKGY
ncbi:D-2-hydroxyacid dehydrogenase [Evansella cellulosilytica]|uniref:D-isomer specific 2-hydroxyacid dehydrogenase NAD-binding protein n=1 Tax=Evansella cellulosilytica (strain ATCC 21833 / DSM 2522 / FERM P-1141 / JCM 9156 / N-4) TaxID=649639 RepID=E6U1A8_EVAC2|nr:D-2-hydroxyacid dehydrogenase [Evansella cellulosilytica]ADU29155.1 D-isomer specific 2-hydroxyacid dehydrogenase NAD-binding protein [Evansella cellulosilytica DSM 2522]